MKHFFKYLSLIVLISGCAEEEHTTVETGSAYFPLQTGLYHVYTVDEIRYSGITEPDILNYEIMTQVVDSFPSAEGGYTYVIHRSRRFEEADAWEPLDTWSVRKNDRLLVVSEGNTPFVKIKFPVTSAEKWDGNALNTLGADEYAVRDLHRPLDIAGTTFEKTMTIEQESNTDRIVFWDERQEVYALDVGLVYKAVIQLHYCTDDSCLGQQEIDSGVEIKIAIKEYGKY